MKGKRKDPFIRLTSMSLRPTVNHYCIPRNNKCLLLRNNPNVVGSLEQSDSKGVVFSQILRITNLKSTPNNNSIIYK